MNRFGSFLNGFFIGAVAGAAIALLMAPKSGEQLREDLKREVDEILEEGRQASDQRRQELENQLNQLRDQQQ
jgi:gas vesicle protein